MAACFVLTITSPVYSPAKSPDIRFTQSAQTVEAYDFVELTLRVDSPKAANPFTEAHVDGQFVKQRDPKPIPVEGFCDSPDGGTCRIRFMPVQPGDYSYSVTYRQGGLVKRHSGNFKAIDRHRRGLLKADPSYPWHFMWEGTREHFYLNGTTAFLLMGWDDERVIQGIIDRFHRYKVNRVRVLLTGRTNYFWTEPVKPGNGFSNYLNTWVAQRPAEIKEPGFDYSHFNVDFWRKFERMLRYARERDINVSVIFDWNDTKVHPGAGSEDEKRYYRYAVSRLSAFSNVTWDLGDDLDSFRDEAWTHATGTFLMGIDPYRHLATSHPVNNDHQDRTSAWFGMTSFQQWPRPLHAWMLDQRRIQQATGRIIPQVNEEYGYEDHYPDWNPIPAPGCSAEGCRRMAWEMAMAGTYQTTGETAKRGIGVPPDTGGGWINGRGDAAMTLLETQSHMVDFFTTLEWWKMDPHDELVDQGAFCLAEPGRQYAVYLPNGGTVKVMLEPGGYKAAWFHARGGETINIGDVQGPSWASPKAPDKDDWALVLRRE